MFNWLKWHQSFINWVSPHFIGDILGSVGGFISGNPMALVAGANLVSGIMGSNAASDAAAQQAAAANNASALQYNMWQTQNNQLAPSRATGYNALNQIGALGSGQSQVYDANGNPVMGADGKPISQTGTGYLTHQFNNEDLNSNLAPNYAWQLGQGQQALNAQNNATGGLVGGNSLKSMQDYAQNAAGNAYQQAFSNYNTQRGNIYNTLASIAGLGQSAQNTSSTVAGNAANAMSSLGVGAANASAAGTIGSTNAITGGLNNAANMNYLSSILKSSGNPFSNSSNYDANGVYTGPGALPDTSSQYP